MLIDVAGLRKSYSAGTTVNEVLRGVDLTLDAGRLGVILGPSGSGKSTLMNIIGGVDRADAGRVGVDGAEVTGMTDSELTEYRRAVVGFIFQYYNLIPNLNAAENIEVVAHLAKSPLDVAAVLDAVGLGGRERSFPAELSGGEQQRVAIARAIVKNPELLLCDEPTGALDFETARDVLALLQKVNREFGTTILMITHNTAIAGMAHVVYRLRSGEVSGVEHNAEPLPAERIEW